MELSENMLVVRLFRFLMNLYDGFIKSLIAFLIGSGIIVFFSTLGRNYNPFIRFMIAYVGALLVLITVTKLMVYLITWIYSFEAWENMKWWLGNILKLFSCVLVLIVYLVVLTLIFNGFPQIRLFLVLPFVICGILYFFAAGMDR